MNTKSMLIMPLILLTLLSSIPRSTALDGTNVWEKDGYIEYEMDVTIEYNRDLAYGGNQVYPAADYPNYDVTGAKLRISYSELLAGKMIFVVSSTNAAVQEIFFGQGETSLEVKVNPSTGFSDSGGKTLYFSNTSAFKDGYKTDFSSDYSYEDDDGKHSMTKYYEVQGNPRNASVRLESEDIEVPVWDMEIKPFDLEYTKDSTDYIERYDEDITTISQYNGVILGNDVYYSFAVNNEGDRPYIDAFTLTYSMRAVNIEGVAIDPPEPTTSDGESDGGFLNAQLFAGILGLVALTYSVRKINRHVF